jgi:hypothetical protein
VNAALQTVSIQLAAASPSDGGLELSKSAPKTVLTVSIAVELLALFEIALWVVFQSDCQRRVGSTDSVSLYIIFCPKG